ncbi:MAG: hypothetical protein H7338_14185 [Candidatus Sericytochromatia bacterium]|nr:hypothetical protein [Candidatus Sericytochromatia bacterium]
MGSTSFSSIVTRWDPSVQRPSSRSGPPIAAATASTYMVVFADVGSTIRCRVTGTNDGGSASATSAQSVVVVVASGVIMTVAGNGIGGFLGNGTAATAAKLNGPTGATVDAAGNLYIADKDNHRIRKITP